MYREVAQWRQIRRRIREKGTPKKQVSRETGISRRTINKMLTHENPPGYGPRPTRYPKLGPYISAIDRLLHDAAFLAPAADMTIKEVVERLRHDEGFSGSYDSVRKYIQHRARYDEGAWERAYDLVVRLPKTRAIDFIRLLLRGDPPVLRSARLRPFVREATCSCKSTTGFNYERQRSADIEWMRLVLQKEISADALRRVCDVPDFATLLDRLYNGRLSDRNRSMAILASRRGLSSGTACDFLGIDKKTYRKYLRTFENGGHAALFARQTKSARKFSTEASTAPPGSHADSFFSDADRVIRIAPKPNRRSEARQVAFEWMRLVLQKHVSSDTLRREICDVPDFAILLDRLYNGRLSDRNRSMAVLASRRGLRPVTVCDFLGIDKKTYRKYLRAFENGGHAALFARQTKSDRKFDNEAIKQAVFEILHQPPSNYGINRTTWIMRDLARVLREKGQLACPAVIRKITKAAGYKWRKAKVVLTSNDPTYTEKLGRIRSILSNLQEDEAFFSIDEYGPFAIKTKPGRTLVPPGIQPTVPQWQKSRGCMIMTAALDLAGNQVTHFYSAKKNTGEMIRMMDILTDRYAEYRKLYLSWDAASWHISKQLFARIEAYNAAIANGGSGPLVETAPLPAGAQFLNVIESVFSGMARAIIHNSDYNSVDEAKTAIDRYFAERNTHFRQHPRRAGKKIWGKEREPAVFSEANNCKDPRYR